MPRFAIEGPGLDPLELDSDNWMAALGEALAMLGDPEAASGVDCDVRPDGDIDVRTSRGSFTIHEVVETIARFHVGPGTRVDTPRLSGLGLELGMAPSPLDAPDPTESVAWKERPDTSEEILNEIHARAAALRDAVSVDDAAGKALDLLMTYIPAESGAVLLGPGPGSDLTFVAARGPRSRGLVGQVVPAGKGIAGLSVRSGMALTVREAGADPRHYGGVDDRTGYRSIAILCVPVRTARGTVGCLELLNPFAGTEFASWHQNACTLVAARVAQRALAPASP